MLKNVSFHLEINCKGRSVESKFLKYVQRQKHSVHHILSFSLHMLRMALGKLFILIRESTISDLIFYMKAVIISYFAKYWRCTQKYLHRLLHQSPNNF